MKCEYCGGNISIEHERCPFCDAANPFYEAHRKDMKEYKQNYESTKEQVMKKTNRVTGRAVYITAIVILSMLIILCLVMISVGRDLMWNIAYNIQESSNKKNANKYVEIVDELEENGDYIAFSEFMDKRYSYKSESPLLEYTAVKMAADYYVRIVDTFARAIDNGYYSQPSEMAERINSSLEGIYNCRKEFDSNPYNKAMYGEKHLKAVEDIISESHMLLEAYLGIDKETISALPEMSKANRLLVLEDAVKEVYFDVYE